MIVNIYVKINFFNIITRIIIVLLSNNCRGLLMKKLYRSRKNRKIAGVCGGIGEYFDIDPTLIRLLWVVLVLAAGTGILAYILGIIIMPENPEF